MPVFHRAIAEKMISTKAQDLAKQRGAEKIEETRMSVDEIAVQILRQVSV